MTDKVKQEINRKVEDMFDELHDLFVLLHDEKAVQILPSEYSKYLWPLIQHSMIELTQDLMDCFDEEPE